MPNSNPIKKAETPSDAKLTATMDYAGTAIFLLSDYRRFGLAERVCYHFDLIEALVEKEKSPSSSASDGNKVTVLGGFKTRPSSTSGIKVYLHVNKDLGSKKGAKTLCALRTGTFSSSATVYVDVGDSLSLIHI